MSIDENVGAEGSTSAEDDEAAMGGLNAGMFFIASRPRPHNSAVATPGVDAITPGALSIGTRRQVSVVPLIMLVQLRTSGATVPTSVWKSPNTICPEGERIKQKLPFILS